MIARKPRAAIRPRAGWAAPPLLLAGTLLAVHGLHAAGPASVTNINPPPANGTPAVYDRGVTDPATGGQGTVRLRGHVSSADGSPVTSVQLSYYAGAVAPANLVVTRTVPVGTGTGVPAGPYQDVFDPGATGLYIVTAVPLNGMTDVGPGGENEIVQFEVRNDIAAGPVASFEIGKNGRPNVFVDAAEFYTYTNSANIRLQGTARADAAHDITQIDAQNLNFGTDAPASFVQSVPFAVAANTTRSYDLPWALTPGPDGPRTVQVRFEDSAGHLSRFFKRGILLDTVAPNVATQAPAGGACFTNGNIAYAFATLDQGSTAVPPTGSGLDPNSAVLTIQSLDGQAVATPNPAVSANLATGSFTATSTNLPTGAYRQTFTVRDYAGNIGSTLTDFRVDTNRPTATITSPAANQTRSGVIVVTGSVADNATTRESGLASYTVSLTGQAGTPTAGKSYTFTQAVTGTSTQINVAIDTLAQNLPDGPYTLSLVATDQCGNTSLASAQNSFTIVVANNSPTVTITAPAEGACVNTQKPTITAQITRAENVPLLNGANPANLKVQVNGKTISVTSTDSGPAGAGTRSLSIVPTNNLSLGNNGVVVEVRDNSNPPNVGTSDARTFVVDLAPPTATLTSPKAGSVVSGTIIVTGSLTDDVALKSGTLTLTATPKNGGTPTTFTINASGTATNVAQPIDTTLFQDGTATLTLSAVDACNQASVNNPSVTFTIDNTAPVLTGPANNVFFTLPNALCPPDADTNTAGVQVAVEVPFTEANLDTARSQLFLDNTDISAQASFAGGKVTASPTVPLGSHTFRAVVVDAAGHATAATSNEFVVDLAPPTATLTSPKAGSVVSGTVTVTGSLTDDVALKSGTLTLTATPKNGVTPTTFTINASGTATTVAQPIDTTLFQDGAATLTLSAVDACNQASVNNPSVTFTIDNTAPGLTGPDTNAFFTLPNTLVPPDANTSAPGRQVAVDVPFTEPNLDASNSKLFLDNTDITVQASFAGGHVTAAPTVGEGQHTFRVVLTDFAGHTTTTTSNPFFVDVTKPTATFSTPAAGSVVSGTISVTGTVTDNVALSSATLTLVDSLGKTVTFPITVNGTATTFNQQVDTTTLAGGPVQASVSVTDIAGNTNSASRNFTVSNGQVSITINQPTAEQLICANSVTVTGTISGIGLDPANTRLDIDGQVQGDATFVFNGTGATFTLTRQVPTELSEGRHTVTVRSQDVTGHVAPPQSVTFTVVATAPVIAITSPSTDQQRVNKTTQVAATVHSNAGVLTLVKLEVVGPGGNILTTPAVNRTLARVADSPIAENWNTTGVPDGTYTIRVSAKDACDQLVTATRTVIVDNTPPAVSYSIGPATRTPKAAGGGDSSGTVIANSIIDVTATFTDPSGPISLDSAIFRVREGLKLNANGEYNGAVRDTFGPGSFREVSRNDDGTQVTVSFRLLLSAKKYKRNKTYVITVSGARDALGNTNKPDTAHSTQFKVIFR